MEDLISGQSLTPEVSSVLHSVFLSCDENQNGFVSVSKLIAFLKEKANDSEVLNFLDELTPILDEEGTDPSIDWDTCYAGLQQWIEYIHNKSFGSNTSASSITTSSPASISLSHRLSSHFVSSTPANYVIQKIMNISNSSTYSNDSIEYSDLSWDQSDVQIKLEELEITNKRLSEDNTKLKCHLHSTEDQNSMVLQENDQLKTKLVKYEKLLEESKKVWRSHNELKMTVVEYQNLKNDLIDKTCELEKENNVLQQVVAEYESKISRLDTSLEVIREEKMQLKHEVSLQKNLLSHIEDLKENKECVVEQSTNKSECMSSLIAELSLANEVLKAQKTNIESELSEMKQDMCRLTMMNPFNGLTSSTPLMSSTARYDKPSIDQEIKAELNNPSGVYNTNEVRHHFDFSDVSDISTPSSPCSPKAEKYSHIVQQCRKKFKEKKEIVLKKIEEIVNKQENTFDGNKTAVIVEDLSRELESFTEKIAEFAQEKQTAEKRAFKLAAVLKRLKDENRLLEESRDNALQKYLSITSQESQRTLDIVPEELKQKKDAFGELQGGLDNGRNDVSIQCNSFENESLIPTPTVNECDSEQKIHDLINIIDDLEARNIDFSRKIYEQEEFLATKRTEVILHKKNVESLEQQVSKLKSQYLSELQTIHSMIPYDDGNTKQVNFIACLEIKDKLLDYINNSIHENNRLLGVRESPDGGSHYTDNTIQTDELQYFKQEYSNSKYYNTRAVKINRECRSSASQTDNALLKSRDASTQTDLDMTTMNNVIDCHDLFPHDKTRSNIPSRLRKHNSIDMSDVTIETELKSDSRYSGSIVGEEIVNPVNEECAKISDGTTNDLLQSTSGKTSETFTVSPSDEASHKLEESTSYFTATNFSDENNNQQLCSPEDSHTSIPHAIKITIEKDEQDKKPDSDCDKTDNKHLNVANLNIAKLIEYDRSDMSSDSETEKNKKRNRRISLTRGKRNRAMNRKRSNVSAEEDSFTEETNKKSEEQDSNKSINSGTGTPTQRRRRIGVSAEPVRVSWSTLRESFKQQQQQMTDEDINTADGNTEGDSSNTQELSEDRHDVPSIEIEDNENQDDEESNLTPEQINLLRKAFLKNSPSPKTSLNSPKTLLSPKNSLQIPMFDFDHNSFANLNDSEISNRSYIEDKDLERNFNNLVFSFKTDQYTLQKRMENQERARDVSESGMDKEIARLSTLIQDLLKYDSGSSELFQVYTTLGKQSDILRKAAMKISAQSEQHGCYQQEHNMSPLTELVIQYVNALRFNTNKLKAEMQICRERLAGTSIIDSTEYSFSTPKVQLPTETNSEVSKTQEQTIETIEENSSKKLSETSTSSSRSNFSFVSVTKSLLIAQGISKLRQRKQNCETVENHENSASADNNTYPVKKCVSFKEQLSAEESLAEKILASDIDIQPSWMTTLSKIRIPKKVKNIGAKIFIALLIFAMFYTILSIIANSLEVDTIRLHDKLLRFIPHSIERGKEPME